MINNTNKFGGIIPSEIDKIKITKTKYNSNHLFFSHGRSAMIWLIKNHNFDASILCAYTWPAIPRLMKKYSLKNYFFDFNETKIDKLINSIDGKILVIIPLFYGSRPILNYKKISNKYKDKIHLLLDGAQTSFAHLDYDIPINGSILSCPHKSTSLNDGSILYLKNYNKKMKKNYSNLKEEFRFSEIKKKSRQLMSLNSEIKENKGLSLIKSLEEKWKSDPPMKMNSKNKKKFMYIDEINHKKIRRRNFFYFKKLLNNFLPPIINFKNETPFAYPTLVNNRSSLLKKLHKHKIYATALWYDASINKNNFPKAYEYKKKLIAFPIDQRYSIKDISIMAILIKRLITKKNVISNN